ncbi:MAG TPA: response regulator [Gammaproteobacteria bacterium]|nr:response regulator [Gammaproteobacteria bacterium]
MNFGLKHSVAFKNPLPQGKTSSIIIVAIIALATMLFTLDVILPLGVAGGVPYVLLVLSGLWLTGRLAVIYLAVLSSALTLWGFFLSPTGGIGWVVLVNRSYALLVVWAVAIVIWWIWQEPDNDQPGDLELPIQDHSLPTFAKREHALFAILVIIVIVTAGFAIARFEQRDTQTIAKSLQVGLKNTHVNIRNHLANLKKAAIIWANHRLVDMEISKLLGEPNDAKTLINNRAQRTLREWLVPELGDVGYLDFDVIGKDNINLASTYDDHIGVINSLVAQGNFLQRVRAGETLVSLPQQVDMHYRNTAEITDKLRPSMFIATPVKNDSGAVIAILVFRLDPDKSFTPVFEQTRVGESGETYAFNKNGRMISESRFNEQLRKIGLITGQHSTLLVELRDPGGNMVSGYTPSLPRNLQPLTRMAQSATAGESGMDLTGYNDYRGVPVVGAWLWDNKLNFGIATEVNKEQAYASFGSTRFTIITFTALILAVLLLLAAVTSRARRRIELSEAKYRNSINSTTEGYCRVDAKGRVREVNHAFCKMLGFQSEEIVGKPLSEFCDEESRILDKESRILLEQKLASFKTTAHRTYESGFCNQQGKTVYVAINATTIRNRQGEVAGSFAFITNITDNKRYEKTLFAANHELEINNTLLAETTEQLEMAALEQVQLSANLVLARDRAVAASRAKSTFLSSMSHELRTPMNAILGFAEMLEFNPKEPPTKTQKISIGHIIKGGRHLLQLINEILDLAKIESGKMALSITDVSARAVLDECLALTLTMVERREIEVIIAASFNTVGSVRADHMRFRQSLLNLISNAIKYNHQQGKLTFDCHENPGGMLHITVTDTGVGISADQLDELFKPFTRLGEENSAIEGTGIGLTITKQLIERMGGRIGVDTDIGKGSTFWIELPLSSHSLSSNSLNSKSLGQKSLGGKRPGEKKPPEDHAVGISRVDDGDRPPSQVNRCILYIEDNPPNLQLMEMIVEHIEGFSLLLAPNAEAGIALAINKHPDLIILDINLPGMNGFAALEKLQSLKETGDIPVIALSANAMPKDIKKGLEAGFKYYLTKPINIENVVNVINTIFN